MKFRRSSLLLCLFLLAGGALSAQAPAAGSALPANTNAAFVSKLYVSQEGGRLFITWKDCEDFPKAQIEIYRSTAAITKENFAKAEKIAVVNPGEEQYYDTPKTKGTYFYALLLREGGLLFENFVMFRNLMDEGVEFTPVAQTPARVTGLTAAVVNQKIKLTFTVLPTDGQVSIFRAPAALATPESLKTATVLATVAGTTAQYEDAAPAGIEFFYAVADARAFAEGKATLTPGQDATAKAVSIPLTPATVIKPQATIVDLPSLSPARADLPSRTLDTILPSTPVATTLKQPLPDALRRLPLPLFNLTADVETGARLNGDLETLPTPKPIKPATAKIFAAFAKSEPPQTFPLPDRQLLATEQGKTAAGTQKNLNDILGSSFSQGKWDKAVSGLRDLLKLELEAPFKSRVHFYIGQSLTAAGDYRHAYLEMLLAREAYFKEVQPWLEALMERIRGQ